MKTISITENLPSDSCCSHISSSQIYINVSIFNIMYILLFRKHQQSVHSKYKTIHVYVYNKYTYIVIVIHIFTIWNIVISYRMCCTSAIRAETGAASVASTEAASVIDNACHSDTYIENYV